jgi:glutamate dehydrogenase/leucine dehydrogenase
MPLLKNYYGTGGDLHVDEIHEVIPITESYGLWHPQEGIVNGHFHANEPQKIRKIGQLRQGVSKVLEDPKYTPNGPQKYKVADMITGFGVSEAVRHFYSIWGGSLRGKRAIVQGWGNVGASAACFLAVEGVKVVAIIDREGGLIKEDGFTMDEIRELFINREGNQLSAENLIPFEEMNRRVWDLNSEIFIPAAASRLISQDQAQRMVSAGLEVISCGANVPFADQEIFMGPIGLWMDERVSVIPDFIANCGMARTFAYLMSDGIELTDHGIFSDVSATINEALKRTFSKNQGKFNLAQTSYEIAISQLM